MCGAACIVRLDALFQVSGEAHIPLVRSGFTLNEIDVKQSNAPQPLILLLLVYTYGVS
jgi:hypothetical protein